MRVSRQLNSKFSSQNKEVTYNLHLCLFVGVIFSNPLLWAFRQPLITSTVSLLPDLICVVVRPLLSVSEWHACVHICIYHTIELCIKQYATFPSIPIYCMCSHMTVLLVWTKPFVNTLLDKGVHTETSHFLFMDECKAIWIFLVQWIPHVHVFCFIRNVNVSQKLPHKMYTLWRISS